MGGLAKKTMCWAISWSPESPECCSRGDTEDDRTDGERVRVQRNSVTEALRPQMCRQGHGQLGLLTKTSVVHALVLGLPVGCIPLVAVTRSHIAEHRRPLAPPEALVGETSVGRVWISDRNIQPC
jgi:hypothetical protein